MCQARTQAQPLTRITARELLAVDFPPLADHEEILPAGCTLLTGKSKDGKSLAAYDIAVAVASNGRHSALRREPGSVWYLALEDGERRARHRLSMSKTAWAQLGTLPGRLKFTLWEAPRLGEGLEEELSDWITTTPDARLIIIDILEKSGPLRKPDGNNYAAGLHHGYADRLAQERNVAILVVHHANRLNPADFRDSASGGMSLIGGADNYWSLSRLPMSEEATLSVIGRDIVPKS